MAKSQNLIFLSKLRGLNLPNGWENVHPRNEWNTLVKEVVNKPTSKAWQDESTPESQHGSANSKNYFEFQTKN